MMKTPVSILSITMVCIMSAFPSNGAQMTSQIRELLDQKEEKIKKLEECDGKRKGWMIAGISTIGLTAVGVGVNIAQANKSNKLSGEIEQSKQELARQEEHLSRINNQISAKEREKAERERERVRVEQDQIIAEWNGAFVGDPCGDTNSGKWMIIDNGDTKCLSKLDYKEYKCACSTKTSINTLDFESKEPDGKIGEPCEDGKGTWVVGGDDTNKICLDVNGNGLQDCHCELKKGDTGKTESTKKQGDVGTKENKETSLQKCLRERSGDAEGTACCYLSKSVATYENGRCQCKGDKEFSIGSDGRGKCGSVDSGKTTRTSTQKDGYGYIEFAAGGEYTEYCDLFEPGTWCAVIDNNTYNGDAVCSALESSFGDTANISGSSTGMYCYCRLSSGKKWVNVEQTTSCETTCAYHCAYQFYSNRSFRDYFK